ncbi:MAG TPA: cold shock domain-containing protein [bacterium]|nr:cold shock domain-containing protein [bacterium]
MTGRVRWFESEKGYGFIEPDDRSGDVYVHFCCLAADGGTALPGGTAVVRPLEPGDKVQFEVVEAPYGRQATQVRRVGGIG